MRITNNMMVSTLLRNLSTNAKRLNDYQAQLSSEMRINKLSDDPLGVVTSLRARNSRANLEMYQLNLDSAFAWMEAGETALMDVNKILQDIYELSIDASTDAKTAADRKIMANKVKEFQDQLVQTLNATLSDKYVFGGYNNLVQPFVQKNGSLYYNGYRMEASATTELNFEQFQADVASALQAAVSAVGGGTTKQDAMNQLEAAQGALTDMINAGLNIAARRDSTVEDMMQAMQIARDDLAANKFGGATPTPEETAIVAAMDDLLDTVEAAKDAGIDVKGLKKNLEQTKAAMESIHTKADAVDTAGSFTDVTNVLSAVSTEYADEAAQAILYPDLLKAEGEKKYEIEVGYGLRLDVCMNGVDVMGLGDKNIYTILGEMYDALVADYVDPNTDPLYYASEMVKQLDAVAQDAGASWPATQTDMTQMIADLDDWLSKGEEEALRQEEIVGKSQADRAQAVVDHLRANVGGSGTWTSAEQTAAQQFIQMAEDGIRAGMTLEDVQKSIREVRAAYREVDTAVSTAGNLADLQAASADLAKAAEGRAMLSDGGKSKGSIAEDITPFISRLQGAQKEILALTSIFGARVNRCEILQARYEIDFINYTSRISNVEDIDTAETIMWFKMAESVYNAALSAGASVIQPTLMDFLR